MSIVSKEDLLVIITTSDCPGIVSCYDCPAYLPEYSTLYQKLSCAHDIGIKSAIDYFIKHYGKKELVKCLL